MALRRDAAELRTARATARARRRMQTTLRTLVRKGTLSEIAGDMLQAELDIGASPDLYWDAHEGRWFVWSGFDERRYGLSEWEALCERIARKDWKGSGKGRRNDS